VCSKLGNVDENASFCGLSSDFFTNISQSPNPPKSPKISYRNSCVSALTSWNSAAFGSTVRQFHSASECTERSVDE
jgi:hypothetical protein